MALDDLADRGFQGLDLPSADRVKEAGLKREYLHTSFDEVWGGSLRVLMQRAIIVRASKDTGLIVCAAKSGQEFVLQKAGKGFGYWTVEDENAPSPWFPSVPSAFLLEETGPEEVVVYVDWLDELYRPASNPETRMSMSRKRKQELANRLFDELAGEVFASKRWDWLE
jgi:hypothetical protein